MLQLNIFMQSNNEISNFQSSQDTKARHISNYQKPNIVSLFQIEKF